MNQTRSATARAVTEVSRPGSSSPVVLVCEHASRHIPAHFNNLGLSGDVLHSHIAWDPGALAVARAISDILCATLVTSNISRLVYDCNRPPDATDAMPSKSEAFEIPGNMALSTSDRAARAKRYYEPFCTALARVISDKPAPVIVTIHSFTPVYNGRTRQVEIGLLHDRDTRLADAMLTSHDAISPHKVRRNEPYGPDDGVTHTLKEHALPGGLLNVMIEIRNDLITTNEAQESMAAALATWISGALTKVGAA